MEKYKIVHSCKILHQNQITVAMQNYTSVVEYFSLEIIGTTELICDN